MLLFGSLPVEIHSDFGVDEPLDRLRAVIYGRFSFAGFGRLSWVAGKVSRARLRLTRVRMFGGRAFPDFFGTLLDRQGQTWVVGEFRLTIAARVGLGVAVAFAVLSAFLAPFPIAPWVLAGTGAVLLIRRWQFDHTVIYLSRFLAATLQSDAEEARRRPRGVARRPPSPTPRTRSSRIPRHS